MSSTPNSPPSDSTYLTVPQEARRILHLLARQNPALKLDDNFIDDHVVFEGGADPIQPGPLKSAAVVAAHFAALGAVADQIAQLRYNDHNTITIDTDHSGYFLACVALFQASGKGPMEAASLAPNFDQDWWGKPMHHQATAIYPTKDGRSFMVHGSLNASPLLALYGLDENDPRAVDRAAARRIIAEFVLTKTAAELEKISVDAKECGSICYEPEEWAATEMGKALAARPLIDVEPFSTSTRPIPFPSLPPKANRRPLEGIKVIAMVRVIAGPMIGRTLAELGATVIKINPPHLRDISMFQFTLTVGTKTVGIDLRNPEDKAKLVKLVGEADVFIDGYRAGAMGRLGFDEDDVVRIVKEARGEDAGIVYVHENCFGQLGPYNERPGWQQIADVASGAAMIQSRGLGYTLASEAVLPPLPIADLTTGVLAATGVLCALRDRVLHGGSHRVVASLTASNVFSISPEVGLYPQSVVDRVQEEFGFEKMTGADGVLALLVMLMSRWKVIRPEQLDMENSSFFMKFEEGPFGPVRMLAPVLRLSVNASGWEIPPRPFCHDEATYDF